MHTEETQAKLKALVAEILEVDADEIADDANFKHDFGADSITGIEILAAIEAEFGLNLPESYVENMTDMRSVYAITQQHLEAQPVGIGE
ncbi:acyl carrier protein [Erwinia sp. CGal63]|uniref:acyl carrier protein n=1 Tax=Erwinia sp. CGal63 TaxID=2919889 RepID=UPI00300A68C1